MYCVSIIYIKTYTDSHRIRILNNFRQHCVILQKWTSKSTRTKLNIAVASIVDLKSLFQKSFIVRYSCFDALACFSRQKVLYNVSSWQSISLSGMFLHVNVSIVCVYVFAFYHHNHHHHHQQQQHHRRRLLNVYPCIPVCVWGVFAFMLQIFNQINFCNIATLSMTPFFDLVHFHFWLRYSNLFALWAFVNWT